MNTRFFRLHCLTSAAYIAVSATGALAQNTTPAPAASPIRSDSGGPSDIIVTARRIQERLQDVPISITAFNQQQLSNRNVVSAQDLATYTPSLSANTNFGTENVTFAIRGFVQDVGTQPSVGVYFADVVAPRGAANNLPIGDGATPGDFFDLQNVQVLKGPQGTLFGRNTTGGAVLFVPQKPTSKTEGYIEGSYGNYDQKRIQAVFNTPLGDNARFRIGIDHMNRDGYVKNTSDIGPKDFNSVDYTAVRASLVVDLTPNLENYTIVSYLRSTPTGSAQKLVACDPNNFLGAGLGCPALARNAGQGFYTVQNTVADEHVLTEQWQLINTTTWHASDTLTVKNIVSYAQFRQVLDNTLFGVSFNTADLSPLLGTTVPASTVDYATTNALPNGGSSDQSTFTDEVQFQGNAFNNRLTWQAGGYIEISSPLALVGSQSPVLIHCANANLFQCDDVTTSVLGPLGGIGSLNYTVSKTTFHDYGLYSQATYALTDKLKVTGGIRYTWDSVDANGRLLTFKFPQPNVPVPVCTLQPSMLALQPADCTVSERERSRAPTWLVDLEYKPIDNMLAYIKYSRGYRAGGITLQAPAGAQTFRPEKVDTYEGGLKTSFNGFLHGTFDVAGFYNKFSDQQLQLNLNTTVPGLSGASAIFNAGKSRIYGAEVDTSLRLFTGFTLDADYTYLNAKIQRIAPISIAAGSPYVVSSPAFAGDPLILAPKNKFSITGTYALPLDPSNGRISVSVNFSHTDKQLSNYVDRGFPDNPAIFNLGYLQPQNLLNLSADWHGVEGLPIDLGLFATNVTQQHYYSYVSGNAGQGFELVQLGQPRMFGARLRYRFGS